MSTQGPGQPHIIYQQVIRPPSNAAATTSVVLGSIALFFGLSVPIPILGLFSAFIAGPLAIAGIVTGHIGVTAAARVGIGRTPALVGLVFAYSTAAVIVATTLFWIISAGISASQR